MRLVFQGLRARPKTLLCESAVLKSGKFSERISKEQEKPCSVERKHDATYHECLGYIGLAIKNSAQIQQGIYHVRILLRRAMIEVGNESKRGISTANLEAVFDANRQSMEGADDLAFFSEGIQLSSTLLGLFEENLREAGCLYIEVSH